MSNLTILSKEIRQLDDLYCLNDLHKASGGERKHTPSRFVRNEQTQGLIEKITQNPNMGSALKVVNGGRKQGTYACKQIVLAYGMWISSELYLAVINAFLEQQESNPKQIKQPQTLTPAQQRHIQERVSEIVNSDKFGFTYQSLYSKLKTRFEVGTYKDIPQFRYPEVCKCLGCKPKGEPVKIPTLPQITKDGRYLVVVENGITNRVKNIDTYNLVNADYIHALQVNLSLIAKQTRLLSGEASPSILDTPLLGADL